MADGLTGLPEAGLRRAAAVARDNCRWMPTVAELRELAGVVPAKAEDAARAAELAAWDVARDWVQHYRCRLRNPQTGRLGMVDTADHSWRAHSLPAIASLPPRVEMALRAVGGSQAIADSWGEAESVVQWLRKGFCEAYRLAPSVAESGRRLLQEGAGEVAALGDGQGAKLALERRR